MLTLQAAALGSDQSLDKCVTIKHGHKRVGSGGWLTHHLHVLKPYENTWSAVVSLFDDDFMKWRTTTALLIRLKLDMENGSCDALYGWMAAHNVSSDMVCATSFVRDRNLPFQPLNLSRVPTGSNVNLCLMYVSFVFCKFPSRVFLSALNIVHLTFLLMCLNSFIDLCRTWNNSTLFLWWK